MYHINAVLVSFTEQQSLLDLDYTMITISLMRDGIYTYLPTHSMNNI